MLLGLCLLVSLLGKASKRPGHMHLLAAARLAPGPACDAWCCGDLLVTLGVVEIFW